MSGQRTDRQTETDRHGYYCIDVELALAVV